MASSDDTRQLVQRLGEAVREIESWVTRGGSRWWLCGWLQDARYLLDRIEQQDDIDRLENRD